MDDEPYEDDDELFDDPIFGPPIVWVGGYEPTFYLHSAGVKLRKKPATKKVRFNARINR